jgi:hypothetical protein
MANHRIPEAAVLIERHHGIDVKGNVVTLSVYQHTRKDHPFTMFFIVQYRELNRRIDISTRHTRQYSGMYAWHRMDIDLRESREMLARSRERAARRMIPGG